MYTQRANRGRPVSAREHVPQSPEGSEAGGPGRGGGLDHQTSEEVRELSLQITEMRKQHGSLVEQLRAATAAAQQAAMAAEAKAEAAAQGGGGGGVSEALMTQMMGELKSMKAELTATQQSVSKAAASNTGSSNAASEQMMSQVMGELKSMRSSSPTCVLWPPLVRLVAAAAAVPMCRR